MRSEQHNTNCLDDPEHVFNDGRLWEELEHPDPARRASALAFVDALADLAALRADRRGTSFLIERHRIFKTRSILRDIRSDDVELIETAARVFLIAMKVKAVMNGGQMPTMDVIRTTTETLVETVRNRVAEAAAEAVDRKGARQP